MDYEKPYTFKSIPRLLEMVIPCDRAKCYCQKLIDTLREEGYVDDAKIITDYLKEMNGENVAMAVQDITELGRCYLEHEKQDKQKPFDYENAKIIQKDFAQKVEPKFKVGNWYQCTKDFFGKGVTFDKNTAYYCAKEGCLQNEYGCHIAIVKDLYDNFKLWDISDAKDGDVLCYETKNDFIIFIYKNGHAHYHCCYSNGHLTTVDSFFIIEKYLLCYLHPATKEQRELLFERMREKGYEWDDEKKELKTDSNDL